MEENHRNALKGTTGLQRLRNALRYSRDGFITAWTDEQAFRQIVYVFCISLPLALCFGRTWAECVLLLLLPALALVVELLNSAIENTVDRISPELHPLAKKAKDLGSAAQCAMQICILLVWGSFFFSLLRG